MTGELTPLPVRTPVVDVTAAQRELAQTAEDFRRSRTVGHAADLLSAAVVLEQPRAALEAARFLLAASHKAGSLAVDMAHRIVATVEIGSEALAEPTRISARIGGKVIAIVSKPTPKPTPMLGGEVRKLRQRLYENPRNPIGWLNLSRLYAVLGENEKAERAMRAALTLAPNHRYALRSASRFFLHVGKADEAHGLLRRSPATRQDPWLMAAELAVATVAGREPRMAKQARAVLSAGRHAPFHLGEVASALATLEASAGSSKMARKLFQQALIEPTENSIAQAEWASRYLRLFDFDPRLLSQPRTYEANAWAAYTGQQWQSALEHARHWVADEPFSGRAAGMGSAVAAVALEEFDVAVAFAQQGVLANPDDLVLRNNLVFTLAEAGRLQDAVRVHEPLRRAPLHGATRVMWLANGGLLEYRAGRADTGKALYEQAVTLARDIKDIGLARIAAAYWAGEEFRTLPPDSGDDATIDGVIAELRQNATPDILLALARLERIRKRACAHSS